MPSLQCFSSGETAPGQFFPTIPQGSPSIRARSDATRRTEAAGSRSDNRHRAETLSLLSYGSHNRTRNFPDRNVEQSCFVFVLSTHSLEFGGGTFEYSCEIRATPLRSSQSRGVMPTSESTSVRRYLFRPTDREWQLETLPDDAIITFHSLSVNVAEHRMTGCVRRDWIGSPFGRIC